MIADEPAMCYVLPIAKLRALARMHPAIETKLMFNICRELSVRLRRADAEIRSTCGIARDVRAGCCRAHRWRDSTEGDLDYLANVRAERRRLRHRRFVGRESSRLHAGYLRGTLPHLE